MYADVKLPKPFNVVTVSSRQVHCDGGAGSLGHPRVFLHILEGVDVIACPYCSCEYIFSPRETERK